MVPNHQPLKNMEYDVWYLKYHIYYEDYTMIFTIVWYKYTISIPYPYHILGDHILLEDGHMGGRASEHHDIFGTKPHQDLAARTP